MVGQRPHRNSERRGPPQRLFWPGSETCWPTTTWKTTRDSFLATVDPGPLLVCSCYRPSCPTVPPKSAARSRSALETVLFGGQ